MLGLPSEGIKIHLSGPALLESLSVQPSIQLKMSTFEDMFPAVRGSTAFYDH